MLLFSSQALRPLLVPGSFPWSQGLRRLAPLSRGVSRRHLAALAGGVVAVGLLRLALTHEARSANDLEPEWLIRPAVSGSAAGFEVNVGQAARDVRFLGEGQGVRVLVLPGELRLASEAAARPSVRLHLEGADPKARLVAEDLQPEERQYRMSPLDESVVAAASYGAVGYRGLYPGVDLWLKLDRGALRLRFRVDRGASADSIRLSYEGALAPAGLRIDGADVRAWQEEGVHRPPVPVTMAPSADRTFGLALGAHDVRRPVELVVTIRTDAPAAAGRQTLAMAQ
jgi:hypothetical protein